MSEWQPIETAPEGCEFLAYDPVADKFDVCARSGFPGVGVYQVQADGEYGPSDDEFDGRRATHWWPLPERPVGVREITTEERRSILEYTMSERGQAVLRIMRGR